MLSAKEAARKEDEKSRLGAEDRAVALDAEKAQERARKAQEFIDAEKVLEPLRPMQSGSCTTGATPAL